MSAELAYVLSEAGCKLILSARRFEELERVRDNIVAKGREAPNVRRLDLSDLASISQFAADALRIHGKIDILINNGGVSNRGSIEDTIFAVHQNIMNVRKNGFNFGNIS